MPECIKNLELWLKFSRGPWEVVVLKEFNGGLENYCVDSSCIVNRFPSQLKCFFLLHLYACVTRAIVGGWSDKSVDFTYQPTHSCHAI